MVKNGSTGKLLVITYWNATAVNKTVKSMLNRSEDSSHATAKLDNTESERNASTKVIR